MWMWNYITGADPEEGHEVSPEKTEEGSGGETEGGLEEVEIDGLIYLADYENGDIFAYDVQDAKLAGWINDHGEAEFFPADETDRHPTLVMIEETLRNLIWAETDEEGKPKSIEPEWVKLFSDLYWAAQADLRKPLPENIEEVLVPVEDSDDESGSSEGSGGESGEGEGDGPEEGGDGDGGGAGGADGGAAKAKRAPKEGEPGWDVEKLRFTEDEELVEEGGVPATPDGADAGKKGFGGDAAPAAAAAEAPPAPPAPAAEDEAGGDDEGEEDEEDLELMYFDKEKDVVMPMHPVHYQYVKLLEELLAEAGFEYQDDGSSSGSGSSYTGSGSEYTGSGSEYTGSGSEGEGSGDEEVADGDEAEEAGRAEGAVAAKDAGVDVDVGGAAPAAAAAAPPAPPGK